jgi:hypothetical protein
MSGHEHTWLPYIHGCSKCGQLELLDSAAQQLQRYELSNAIPDFPRMVKYDKGFYVRFDDVVTLLRATAEPTKHYVIDHTPPTSIAVEIEVIKPIEKDESSEPLGTCDKCFDGIRDATYFHPKANGCRNWKRSEPMATTPSNEGEKSPEEHFFDARAPFHWNKSDVLKIMREYRSEAAPAPSVEALFGRAMIILKALKLAVDWELAPVIKREIAAICTEFEKL